MNKGISWSVFFGCLLGCVGGTSAEVTMISERPTVDGHLDDPVWQAAKWESGFHRVGKLAVERRGETPTALTEFALLADDKNLYIGIKCHEPLLEKLSPDKPLGDFWHADYVDLFLSPSGTIFDYYQFTSTLLGEGRFVQYWAESGHITPDPYRPRWTSAVARGDGFWSCEYEIPFTAFYMTRNTSWSSSWLVNIARNNTLERELSSWAPVRSDFKEIKRFPKVSGFPIRRPEDDIAVLGAVADIDDLQGGKLLGKMTVDVFAGVAGEYEMAVTASEGVRNIHLAQGQNKLTVPCSFDGNGRHPVGFTLCNRDNGVSYWREYPVETDFAFFKVLLTSPEYRNNFYPGQDSGRIAGTVKSAKKGAVTLTLKGPGIPTVSKSLPSGGGSFSFDTPGFQDGVATLVVSADGESSAVEVRKLPPSKHRMTWISNGNVVVDGRTILRRNMFATYYLGGKKFTAKYDADDLCETKEFSWGPTLEASRLIPGAEQREAVKDAPPSKELLAKIDEVIENWKDKDFGYYYIEDEPECRNVSPVFLKHVYDYVAKKDPYHVIATATRGGTRFINCADLFETHPYLNPHYNDKGERCYGRQPNELGDYVEAFSSLNRKDKCIGFLPTAFSYPGGAFINFREYVMHTWAAMMRGGRTLYPYAWCDFGARASTYEGTRYIFTSFDRLSDFILFGDRREIVRTREYEAVRYHTPSNELLVCVNLSTKPQTVRLKGIEGSWLEFRGDRTVGNVLELSPLETIVATRRKCDFGLKTYAEVDAEIEAAERERLGRDNQLLEKFRQIEVSSSHAVSTCWSLVDGNRDFLGWRESKPNGFYEMAFPKFTPAFSRISVYGYNLEGMRIKVCRLGEWRELKPSSVTTGDYALTYDFGEILKPSKLRLEFVKRDVEIYEIELPGRADEKKNVARGPMRTPGAKWRLDGRNAGTTRQLSYDGWLVEDGDGVFGEADGSLRCCSKMSRQVRLDVNARYFVFDVLSSKRREKGKYTGVTFQFRGPGNVFTSVNGLARGIYTVKMPKSEPDSWSIFSIYNYNLDFTVGSFALVERPENYIEIIPSSTDRVKVGDRLLVRVVLKDPCLDMNCAFFRDCGRGAERFNLNGSGSAELKAKDGSGRLWEVDVPVQSCGYAASREVFVRVTTLGGGLDVPLYANIDLPFGERKAK